MQHTPHQSGASTGRKSISPQPTGFSQIHARGAAEGGGAAMSVLLSWHEKVKSPRPHEKTSPYFWRPSLG